MKKRFQELKTRLTTAPLLTLPEGTEDFVLYCGASRVGLGYVLMQNVKLAYAFRQLKIHERNYPAHDLELVDIMLGSKIWRNNLDDVHVDVFTAQKSVQYAFSHKELNLKQMRWFESLKYYDMSTITCVRLI